MTATNIYEAYNNRKTLGGMLRLDCNLTPKVSVFATVMYNGDNQPSFQFFRFGSSNAATIAALNASGQPTGTGAVLPGFTERLTQVVPQTTSSVTLSSEGNRFRDIERQRALGFVHTYGPLKFDYNTMHGESNVEQNDRVSGGIFTTTVTGIGFRQERLADGTMSWNQTAGPNVYDLASYPTHLLTQKGRKRLNFINAVTLNAEYTLDAKSKSFVKAGARVRAESSDIVGGDRRFTYAGPDGVVGVNPATRINDADLSVFKFQGMQTRSGQPAPFVNVASIAADVKEHPDRWVEDLYYRRQQDFTQTSGVKEQVNAGYLMGGGTWHRRLRVVGGVRVENTRLHGKAFVAAVPLSTAVQIPDPTLRAERDYNNPRRSEGAYTNWFPSGLVTYSFSRNFIARFNWTNSIGRPTFGILVPLETVSTTASTVTLANPSIQPQTGRSLEASLEYYFEPVGVLTGSVFQKDIKNYIVRTTSGFVGSGPDNGFGGNYAGYTIIRDQNTGTATVRGLELNYQQSLRFLPGILSGLGLMANYTRLLPEGDFGSIGPRTTNLIPLFVPTSGNAGITFKWRKLLTRVMWNYTGTYLNVYSTNAALLAYIDERRTVNASVSYALTPRTRIYCDVANVFDEPNRQYLYQSSRRSLLSFSGAWINAGFKTDF
jgi:TonB-dependent receptor